MINVRGLFSSSFKRPTIQAGKLKRLSFCECVAAMWASLVACLFLWRRGISWQSSENIPSDELDLNQCWQQLAATHEVELALCSGSAFRRGKTAEGPLLPHFEITGLGAMADAYARSDRVIVFGS